MIFDHTFIQKKLVECNGKGDEKIYFSEDDGYSVTVVTKPKQSVSKAEAHEGFTDIFFILSGHGSLKYNGNIVEMYEKEGSSGELRGTDIDNADMKDLQQGDVVVLSAGTPHKLDTQDEGISYIVIKIKKV